MTAGRRGLTRADLTAAARTLQQIAAIPSMSTGVVVFRAQGLAEGCWYETHDQCSRDGWQIQVCIPDEAATDPVACRQAVLQAVISSRAEAEGMADRFDGLRLPEEARLDSLQHVADLTFVDGEEAALLCPWGA